MKLLLSAPAIAKLLELDPEATVELARTGAAQVAQEIARRTTREAVEAHINSFLKSEMIQDDWYKKTIATKYQKMLADTMTAMAAAFINDVTHGAINKMILERINETWKELNPAIEQILTAKAEQILRERFAAMFGDKS